MKTSFIENYGFPLQEEMDAAARAVGYELVASNGDFRLYHLGNAPETWGTVTRYDAIGIGTATPALSLKYPSIEETTDADLNHYSFDELKSHKTIYLDGFTYDDQQAAENLVVRLSESGVRIVIGADGIPVNKNSHDRIFLGVRCNAVEFHNGYPILETSVGELNCSLFPEGLENWRTVYLEGLDTVMGTFNVRSGDDLEDHDFDFAGTVHNDNIVMIGLNLGYFYSLTGDSGAGLFLDDILDTDEGALPERTIVPTDVTYEPDRITVTTDRDDVNTALAYHDDLTSSSAVRTRNNLTFVDSGTTVLQFEYPYLMPGMLTTLLGIICLVALTLAARSSQRRMCIHDPASGSDDADRNLTTPAVLLIPAYQPDAKLIELLRSIRGSWNGPIVVVDDGSSDESKPIFDEILSMDGVTLLRHDRNLGKGAALRTGIRWSREQHPECLGVVTADADGQHRIEDIQSVARALRMNPHALVLGCRDFSQPDVPRRSSTGNRLARVMLRITANVSVSDSQTGLRGIPLDFADAVLEIRKNGYELETDELVEAYRRGIPFVEVPIATVYIDGNTSSHYRPLRDTLRIVSSFGKYTASSASSAVVDLALFTVFNLLLAGALEPDVAIPLATFGARVISAGVNFTINRHLVFKTRGSVARYAATALSNVMASAALVTFITMLTGFNATIVKVLVDGALFFVNHLILRAWVFAQEATAR